MQRSKQGLRLVGKPDETPPDTSYEARQRQHIMSRDWSAVLIAADRRAPFGRVWR